MKNIFKLTVLTTLIFLFYGCPTTTIKEEREQKSEFEIQIAYLNLKNLNKRIETKHVNQIAEILKKEEVEHIAIQEVTRYPNVTTRIDLINALAKKTEWRSAFGEMENLSGKQTGNAVLSLYPIISSYTQSFEKIKSAMFESALQTTIEIAANPLIIVNTTIPPKASEESQKSCVKLINDICNDKVYKNIVVVGNLPASKHIRTSNGYDEAVIAKEYNIKNIKLWFKQNSNLRFTNSRIVNTDLGQMIIFKFGYIKNIENKK